MSLVHHLDDATLMSCAAGTLPPALGVVAASHMALCPRCRTGFARAERIGGALLESLAPAPLSHLPHMPEADRAPGPEFEPASAGELPGPLARLVDAPLDAIAWRWLGPGVRHHRIALGPSGGELRLIKADPGRDVPAHGHNGMELTLLLRGSYTDELGRLGVGDISDLDETVEHHPVADPTTGCICVLACERPARFHGWLARLMQPFTGL
jgi:putative transcriptional regulator